MRVQISDKSPHATGGTRDRRRFILNRITHSLFEERAFLSPSALFDVFSGADLRAPAEKVNGCERKPID